MCFIPQHKPSGADCRRLFTRQPKRTAFRSGTLLPQLRVLPPSEYLSAADAYLPGTARHGRDKSGALLAAAPLIADKVFGYAGEAFSEEEKNYTNILTHSHRLIGGNILRMLTADWTTCFQLFRSARKGRGGLSRFF